MSMLQSLENFSKQFEFEPVIKNEAGLARKNKFIVTGMGGSNIASNFIWVYKPDVQIITHRDYGLPAINDIGSYAVLVSSYSGNTEEALSSFNEATERGLPVSVITSGGRLMKLAEEKNVPRIRMPDLGLQPRVALGLSFVSILKVMGDDAGINEAIKLKTDLISSEYKRRGEELAKKLAGSMPIVYSSAANGPIARDWKINFNESGKVPSFYNVFPELNHNEMISFGQTSELSEKFRFIFLKDSADHSQIQKRMRITQKFLEDKGFSVDVIELENSKGPVYKIFSSVLLSNWTAYFTAQGYGLEAEEVPLIEEFKKAIRH